MNSINQLLKSIFDLYRLNYRRLISLAIISATISALFDFITLYFADKLPLFTSLIFELIVLATSTLISLALYILIGNIISGENHKTLADQLRNASKKFWGYLVMSIILTVIIFAGLLLFIIPGIIFAIWYFASGYIYSNNNVKPMIALDMSKKIVAGHFFEVISRLFLISLVPMIPIIFIYILASSLLPAAIFAYFDIFFFFFVASTIYPFFYLTTGVLFKDLENNQRQILNPEQNSVI